MVNVRKISAIAAGALFVGATLGMAAAVTVPSDFSKDMLAKNGEEQAQLVVGANAPGKDADTESANVIKDAVADKLAVTGAGGDIEITYGDQDLDDHDGDDYWTNETSVGAFTVGVTNSSNFPNLNTDKLKLKEYETAADVDYVFVNGSRGKGLIFDANGDGDLKDSDDYTLYDGVWIIDGADGTIRFGYVVDAHLRASYCDTDNSWDEGETFKIKGKKYAATDLDDFDSGEVEIGPAIEKKITASTQDPDPDKAVVISENWKVYYKINQTTAPATGVLYFYEGNSLLDTYALEQNVPFANTGATPYYLNEKISVGDFEDKYKIYLINATTDQAVMTFVDKDSVITISDEEEDVLGYDLVWVNNSDWRNHMVLFSEVYDLEQDETIDIPGTYFQAKFTEEKELDLKRKESETKASGSKWKESKYDDFLREDIWVTAVGGDIEITYGDQDLDDHDGDDYWTNETSVGAFTVGVTNSSNFPNLNTDKLKLKEYETAADVDYVFVNGSRGKGLIFDANGDGDLKDSDDYTLYDGVWIIDGADGTIRFGYVVDAHLRASYCDTDNSWDEGETFKIKGKKYAATDLDDFDSGEVEIGPAIEKKITASTQDPDPDKAVVISENWKVYYKINQTTAPATGVLYFYEGNSLLDTYALEQNVPFANTGATPYYLNEKISVGDFEDKYKIYLINATTDQAVMTFVDKDSVITISDEEEDVLGYDLVWVNNSDWRNHMVLFSEVYDLEQDETIDIPGTYFQAKFTEEKELDLKRKESETKASGSKWKESKYDDFLREDIWVTATGGETKTPELEIVDEESADKDNYNLVLIGGPVANTLTADLVTAGKSTVDWYTSEGDIEVIADAFTEGKYAIIVAGKDRDATRAAADALAAAL